MRPEQELAERNNQEARVEALAKRLDGQSAIHRPNYEWGDTA